MQKTCHRRISGTKTQKRPVFDRFGFHQRLNSGVEAGNRLKT